MRHKALYLGHKMYNQSNLNFSDGVFSNPLLVQGQFPWNNPYAQSNNFAKPNGGFIDTNNTQLQMLQALMKSSPNSGANHAVGTSDWGDSISDNTNPLALGNKNQSVLSALGSQGPQRVF